MPVVYFFLSYLLLALAIPLIWSLVPLWRRAHRARHVDCPEALADAVVRLDAWYAVKSRVLGQDGLRVQDCSRWPCRGCAQTCVMQIHG